jgi:hypothetical protein
VLDLAVFGELSDAQAAVGELLDHNDVVLVARLAPVRPYGLGDNER